MLLSLKPSLQSTTEMTIQKQRFVRDTGTSLENKIRSFLYHPVRRGRSLRITEIALAMDCHRDICHRSLAKLEKDEVVRYSHERGYRAA